MTGAVCICGVWQRAQPMLLNTVLPRMALALGLGSGCGASMNRIINWNCIQSGRMWSGLLNAAFWLSLGSVRGTALGSALFGPWHAGFSSVAVGKSSLVMPISTL